MADIAKMIEEINDFVYKNKKVKLKLGKTVQLSKLQLKQSQLK